MSEKRAPKQPKTIDVTDISGLDLRQQVDVTRIQSLYLQEVDAIIMAELAALGAVEFIDFMEREAADEYAAAHEPGQADGHNVLRADGSFAGFNMYRQVPEAIQANGSAVQVITDKMHSLIDQVDQTVAARQTAIWDQLIAGGQAQYGGQLTIPEFHDYVAAHDGASFFHVAVFDEAGVKIPSQTHVYGVTS